MVRNAVVNGTPAALVRASIHRYGAMEAVDHYTGSRESVSR
jgi:hypothetical protein